MQLNDKNAEFENAGVKLAAITYDAVEVLNEVDQERDIAFPLLHDAEVTVVNAFGVRNQDYEPGHRAYGIPYPGIFVIGADGVIRAKFAEESYRDRPDLAHILEAVEGL